MPGPVFLFLPFARLVHCPTIVLDKLVYVRFLVYRYELVVKGRLNRYPRFGSMQPVH